MAVSPPSSNVRVFHLFPALPPELRQLIWSSRLDASTPRIYSIQLVYSRRAKKAGSADEYDHQPGDGVYLEPHFTHDLVRGTAAYRDLSTTCLEARAAVVSRYPDTLTFRLLPFHLGAEELEERRECAKYPSRTLRFNGNIDIFIFNSLCNEQQAIADIIDFQGGTPADHEFARMRHIGLDAGALRRDDRFFAAPLPGVEALQYGATHGEQPWCSPQQCPDACEREGLPRFLACFPRLERFYIASLPHYFSMRVDNQPDACDIPSLAPCECRNNDVATILTSQSERLAKHNWPTARPVDLAGYCVIYDERADCCIPTPVPVRKVRQHWRTHFPYYHALKHLDIRFMRWVENASTSMKDEFDPWQGHGPPLEGPRAEIRGRERNE